MPSKRPSLTLAAPYFLDMQDYIYVQNYKTAMCREYILSILIALSNAAAHK